MQQKLRAILIDDEVNNLSLLEKMLLQHCSNVEVVATETNALQGIELLRNLKPDLLFLDIQMPHLNGFELLQALEPVDFEVIVVTAYDEFALAAFDHHVLGFLTKPVVREKLIQTVQRASDRIHQKSIAQNIFTLLGKQLQHNDESKIALSTTNGLLFVEESDIIYCESSGNYTHFHMKNGKRIIVSRQLGEYEKLLPEAHFVRIHDKYIIHLHYVNEYIRGRGGEVKINSVISLPVSANRRDNFLSRFERWVKKG